MSPSPEARPQSAPAPASKAWLSLIGASVCVLAFWLAQRPVAPSQLSVLFSPTGASVELSGTDLRAIERQSFDAKVEFRGLKPGTAYRLVVNAPGYSQSIQEIRMPNSGGMQTVEVVLERENALFTVRSEPAGATIFLDGKQIGPAPAVLDEVSPGPHRVEAALQGYVRAELDLVAQAGERRELQITLKLADVSEVSSDVVSGAFVKQAPQIRVGKAMLRVESSHPSKFFIDNMLLGYGQKVEREVDAGRHRVSARADGRGSKYQMVRLESQGHHEVRFLFDVDPVERAMEATDPKRPIYWLIQGGNARGEGRYGDAVNAFQTALQKNPSPEERVSLHRQLSRTLPALKRFNEAIEHLETYLRLAPDAPDATFSRGLLEELRARAARQSSER